MNASFAIACQRIFDGETLFQDHALLIEAGVVQDIVPQAEVPEQFDLRNAGNRLLAPGFVDLQVNGGGGVLFNNQPDIDGIATICRTHASYGTTSVMVTLITDTAEVRDKAILAGKLANEQKMPGYLGLHLEGPHLSQARKGTHDPALIRPMQTEDLEALIDAAGSFGQAIATVAPESVTLEQVRALKDAGYVVSLGHSDAPAEVVEPYVDAGASMVTHLFNAMSQLGNREPGLVGAALDDARLSCGLIADGFHVDPVTMRVAIRGKNGPSHIFLVTDAMSTIGTDADGFELNGRRIYRRDGRLTLADGTLAGADIDMLSCVRYAHITLGLPLIEALRMASRYPAQAMGLNNKGQLQAGFDADFVILDRNLEWHSTWIDGALFCGGANAIDVMAP